ncbi:MAG TPA: hypothetical protein VGR70_18545 [Stellaceae bacterium]|nr:hypothetical protein [Stellaceae bacterium]
MAKGIQVQAEQLIPTLEALASASGVSVLLILAALRNAQIWEIVGGGPAGGVDVRTLSAEGKAELRSSLTDILSGVMSKVKEGDLGAALVASGIAAQRATLR